MAKREPTDRFPSTPREDWHIVTRKGLDWDDETKFATMEYEVYANVSHKDLGGRPFFIVNHKAQIRENHVRLRMDGKALVHVTGVRVEEQFTRSGEPILVAADARNQQPFDLDPRYFHREQDGMWRNQLGQVLPPYKQRVSDWIGIYEEELNPNWERETYRISADQRMQFLINRRLATVLHKQESGDKRGTTLNLQVGGSTGDGFGALDDPGNGVDDDLPGTHIGTRSAYNGGVVSWFQFEGASGAGGTTINSATFGFIINAAETGDPLTNLYFTDEATPAPYPDGGTHPRDADVTTAFTALDDQGWSDESSQTVDVADEVQEIATSHGSLDAFQVNWRDDGSSGGDTFYNIATYDRDSGDAATLDVDTAAAGLALPVAIYHQRYHNKAI